MSARAPTAEPRVARHEPSRVRTRLIALTLAALGAALSSCAGPSRGGAGVAGDLRDAPVAPVAGRAEPGIEVLAWSTDAPLATLATALRAVSRGGDALPPDAAALWAAHGLRAYRVPVSELERLRVLAGAPPRSVRNWLGQALVWTEAVGGPEGPSGQTVALEAERLRLGPGRLRLLARAWVVPEPGERGVEPVLRVELLPQHQDAARPAASDALLGAPPSIAAADQGQLFTRLWVRFSAGRADEAVVLVAAPPGADLERLADEAARADPGAAGSAAPGVGQVMRAGPRDETPAPPTAGDPIGPRAGPPAATIPTIGEAMLLSTVQPASRSAPTSDSAAERAAARPPVTRRVIVVLVPRLPDGYTLLP